MSGGNALLSGPTAQSVAPLLERQFPKGGFRRQSCLISGKSFIPNAGYFGLMADYDSNPDLTVSDFRSAS